MDDRTPRHHDRGATPGSLADAVLAQARRTPDAPAVEDGAVVLDYAGLDRAAARVADRLRARGVGPGRSVAVRLPRSWRLVSVMLGIRRAGATVVPLDRLSPPGRQLHILEDSGAVAVVHDSTDRQTVPDHLTALTADLLLGEDGPDTLPAARRTTGHPGPAARETGPCTPTTGFVFYTSGTTGRPKGVEVTDDGVLRLAAPGYIELGPGRRYGCLSNPAFDALSFEVWTPLLTGGTCVVLDEEEAGSPDRLAAALHERRIDTLFVTVALFNAVVEKVPDCFSRTGQVLLGGEQLNARVVRRWYADNPGSRTVLHNAYGPTEATTFALCHAVPRDFDGDTVPIGTPLPGTGVLLRTEDGRTAEPGEVAELLLSGPALARGYRNLPAETGRRFVRLPHGGGGEHRWYRTGDLVRQDADGLVSYVGRADRQVKVRGFRIEPGEVERQILALPAVRQAYVCTRRDDAGRNELLAFLTPGENLSYDAYDRHLAASLPSYMRPHHTHLVGELPLNANGKVDRSALLDAARAPWRGEHRDDVHVDAGRRRVLDLAEEVLAVTGLRPGDRWIPSGGDSLKALRFRFEALRRFAVDLPQELVLRADFAALADALLAPDATAGEHPPVPVTRASAAPATGEQERLWLMHRRDPADRSYDVPLAFRVDGAVDPEALRGALRRLVERHPALRTRLVPTPQGLTQQVGDPYDPWRPVGARDGEDPKTAAERFYAPAFDLGRGRLLRAAWLPHDGGGLILLHLHHVAVDGWSLGILFRDLAADYAAAVDGRPATAPRSPAVTTLDLAHWQRTWHDSPAYRRRRARLRAHYDEAGPSSPAPEADGAPAPRTARLLRTPIDLVRRGALDRLAARLGLTRFQVLLAAFAWSVYGVTGQSRPLVAAPVANRSRPEFDDVVGMFANTVLLPLATDPDGSLRSLLERHSGTARAVLDGQEVALADVLADHPFRDGGPLFDFLFVLENTEFSALRLPGCSVRPEHPRPLGAKCALTLSVVEHEAGFDCLWEYRDDFGADRAEAAARLFREALDRLIDEAGVTLRDLVAPYRHALPDPGRGAARTPDFTTVAEGFARQVRRTPDAPAVTGGRATLTYAELDARAAALAAELRPRLPADPEAPAAAALYLEPSAEHVVALLAAARLNLTVVPLDPSYPPSLLRHVLVQADPVCVLVAPGRAGALDALAPPGLPRHPVTLAGAPAPGRVPATPPHRALRPLYTLFTSGSTGTPKGVQVSDRTLCNLLTWQRTDGGLDRAAVTQQFSMLSFDVSFQEIFTTLCSGGLLRLVRPDWRQDVPALLEQLESGGAERVFLPYVALQLLAEHGARTGRYPSRLREVITAGEQLVCTDAIRRWFAGLDGARLFNHYGPTETHVVSGLCLEGDPAAWPLRPAIGRPVAGAVLRVGDDGGLPVPPGVTGRLLIGGPMATRCYLGDAGLNRTRFTDDPELGVLYRSGDLARFDTRGLLHYAGREDGQVKVSGHRLELGQVEAALLQYPGVTNAVVAAADGALVACLQYRDAEDPDPADLARHLSGLLPSYVRVGRFRRLTSLPRTPSGKLDRRAAPTAAGYDLRTPLAAAPAASALEGRLAALFEEATGKAVAVDRRYFDAGATSLDLMRFHLRCARESDLPFTVPDLFERGTIRELARLVEDRCASRPTEPTASGTDGPSRTNRAHRGPAPSDDPPADVTSPADDAPRTGAHAGAAGPADEPIAVVGMAVRLPGATDLAAFWDLVTSGGRGIEHFPAAGGRVGARSQLDGPLAFDPGRFTISPQEARLMDPQQRHLLMACAQALAHAGIAAPDLRRTGLVAACGENTYFQAVLREADPAALPDSFRLALHHEKDFLATKAAYHLGLTGPAFTVQSACSSSLVGVHVAAGLLRQGDADVMLAGGVLVDPDLTDGYTYRPQHIFSPDGHCRPFSADAAGTVGASGVGVVVLKPLAAARREGDTVYAVLTGSGLNNDGSAKPGYSAPSPAGQRAALRTALRRSGRVATEVGYVEAHGTGTRLGDPVEATALRQAYDLPDDARLALSSAKSQLGHLGAAAGVVGLVRAVLAVHHGIVPPTVDFDRLNPEIEDGPFRIPTAAEPWPDGTPRVAAVSSFGIGGTNAHLLLEKPDDPAVRDPYERPGPVPCLVLSSSSPAALRADARRIADYLDARPESYPQVLRHLQAGRPTLAHRAATVCPDAVAAVSWLRSLDPADAPAPALPPVPERRVPAPGGDARELAEAWTAGHALVWPAGPAQAPWNFPPPAFDLAEYDFPRAAAPPPPAPFGPAPEDPGRLPADRWLHQLQWARLRRARTGTADAGRTVVVVAAPETGPAAWRGLERHYARVVRVRAGKALERHSGDRYDADPADAAQLAAVLADVTTTSGTHGVDWLHALPLAIDGEVGERSLETARRACLDTVAALCRALADVPDERRPRVWLLSQGAQPVIGAVRRPEAGLLAAAVEIPRQELRLAFRWADLPGADPAAWVPHLSGLLLDDTLTQRVVALRDGYWWYRQAQPVAAPPADDGGGQWPTAVGTHLILGGTGGIGTSVAARLLREPDNRVVLLARRAVPPTALRPWVERVSVVEADLADEDLDRIEERLAPHLHGLAGIVHAAGTAAGALLVRRDPAAAGRATAAKLRGALLVERLIARHGPDHVVHCSSMAALLGGVGQFDYAAANGLLDAFAHYLPDGDTGRTVRCGIGWDAWREVGMAQGALSRDARHQRHLAVALAPEEGVQVFEQALSLRLPHLMVSTTPLEEARRFYEPARAASGAPGGPPHGGGAGTPASGHLPPAADEAPADLAAELTAAVCELLGVAGLDPEASLYDLGADSLTLLELVDEVKRRYGADLDLSRLSHRVSLTEILGHLGAAARRFPADGAEVEVDVWQRGDGHDVLCLLHPVGGDIQAYRPLVSALDERLTVCLIADPALRAPGGPARSISDRAGRYLEAVRATFPDPGRRLSLAGWSFGAWTALSMASVAERAGRPVHGLYLLDPPPPAAGAAAAAYDDRQVDAVFARELSGNRTGGLSERGRDYAERLARCCRANLAAMAGHRLPRLTDTPATVWLAGRPVWDVTSLAPGPAAATDWEPHLPTPPRVLHVDADHYALVAPPHVRAVAAAIEEDLARRAPADHRPDALEGARGPTGPPAPQGDGRPFPAPLH
ncbi:non-ribosomal peptide synthetase [Streptomyces sp. XY152]|uniref:non-ribosomal peptide synthetase n=1 Tax=Streptomyces sp. XY152 TaxID=1415560 RepID=UPI00099D4DC7|nr:non-ribosomal peptide synthetase [Streptomyces sp. XY152]